MGFHHVRVPVDNNEFGSIVCVTGGTLLNVGKGDHNEILSEENCIKAKNSHAVFIFQGELGLCPV